MTEFTAEIKQTKSRKLISNDIEYEVIFRTHDPELIKLALEPSDRVFNVRVTYAD